MRSLLLPLAVVLCVACASARDGDVARGVEAQVWSPYCPGVLLSDCGTRQARELRAEIAERADDGDDEAEILAWVRSEYGSQAIARPEASGFGLVVWLMPLAIFLAGAALLARFLVRASRAKDDGDRAEQEIDVEQ